MEYGEVAGVRPRPHPAHATDAADREAEAALPGRSAVVRLPEAGEGRRFGRRPAAARRGARPPRGDSGDSVSQTSPRSELSQCWGRMRTTTCSPCSLQAKST